MSTNTELIARLRKQHLRASNEAADAIEALELQLKNASMAAIAEAVEVDRLKAEVERWLDMALHGYKVAIEASEESLKDRVALAMEVDRLSAAGVSHCGHRPPCIECRKYAAPIPQQPAEPVQGEPDMFWNNDDADRPYSSIDEFLNDEICNGTELEVGHTRTIQRAIRLPNIEIRITAVNDDECEADYEVIAAAPQPKETK